MIVHPSGRNDATLMRYTASAAHRNAIGLTQPVGFHALLGGNSVIAIEYAIAMQKAG
jgi:hypothetical protein